MTNQEENTLKNLSGKTFLSKDGILDAIKKCIDEKRPEFDFPTEDLGDIEIQDVLEEISDTYSDKIEGIIVDHITARKINITKTLPGFGILKNCRVSIQDNTNAEEKIKIVLKSK